MPAPPVRTSTPESGSAYVVALLALVMLSILGLALAVVTHTESLLGNNERNMERTLAAADVGINVAVAKALVVPDNRPFRLDLADPVGAGSLVTARQEVRVAPLTPLTIAPCDLCMVNQGSEFFRVDHGLQVDVERRVAAGAEARTLARTGVSSMVDFQPWRPTIEAFAGTGGGGATP